MPLLPLPLPPKQPPPGGSTAEGEDGHVSCAAASPHTAGGSTTGHGAASGCASALRQAAGDGAPFALHEELRELDTEMILLHQSLYDAAVRFRATCPERAAACN